MGVSFSRGPDKNQKASAFRLVSVTNQQTGNASKKTRIFPLGFRLPFSSTIVVDSEEPGEN